MAIRVPEKRNLGVSEIRHRDFDTEKIFSISKVFKVSPEHEVRLVWEQTTFVDCNGKAFYDVNGIPFQGKK